MMQGLKLAFIAIFSVAILGAIFMPSSIAFAKPGDTTTRDCKAGNTFFGFPNWYKYLKLDPNNNCAIISDQVAPTMVLIIIAIIEMLLYLAGFIAGFIIIFGAFKFVTSQGDPQKVAAARTTLTNAVIGLVIAVIASQTVAFIAQTFLASASSKTISTGVLSGANLPQVTAGPEQLKGILSIILGLIGAIALLIIVYAGFKFVSSQGDPQKVATARMTILYAVIGLVVAVFAFTIVQFVLGQT